MILLKPKVSKSFCPDASGVIGNFRLKSAGTTDKSNPLAHAYPSLLLRSRKRAGLHKIKSEICYQFHLRGYKRRKGKGAPFNFKSNIVDAARGPGNPDSYRERW